MSSPLKDLLITPPRCVIGSIDMVGSEYLRLPKNMMVIPSIWDLVIVLVKALSIYFCLSFLVAVPLRTRWKILRSVRISAYIILISFSALWLLGKFVGGFFGIRMWFYLWLDLLLILVFGVGIVLFFLSLISEILHREIFVGWRLFVLSIIVTAIIWLMCTVISGVRVRERSECGHDVTCHGVMWRGKCFGQEKHDYYTCDPCYGKDLCVQGEM